MPFKGQRRSEGLVPREEGDCGEDVVGLVHTGPGWLGEGEHQRKMRSF